MSTSILKPEFAGKHSEKRRKFKLRRGSMFAFSFSGGGFTATPCQLQHWLWTNQWRIKTWDSMSSSKRGRQSTLLKPTLLSQICAILCTNRAICWNFHNFLLKRKVKGKKVIPLFPNPNITKTRQHCHSTVNRALKEAW